MAAEAQAVVSMRLLGMAGLWSVTSQETTRMMREKTEKFPLAMQEATRAALRGDDPFGAALGPLHRQTRANALRLARRGPKWRL
ncbi:antifreeze protein [Mameliella alba]|nr:antifreeze protein [Mameliella alba]MBY6168933.1 antifreeze protein [Mameliella alba]MBY6173846.1 antifreeze protein [Mameliella alba]